MKTHTQITVAEFLTEVGRTKFEQVLGHSPPVVTRAKNEGLFSSSWYIGIRNWCRELGMDCPEHLFKWHVKTEGKYMSDQHKAILAEDEFCKFKKSVESEGVANDRLVAAIRASREKFGTGATAAKESRL